MNTKKYRSETENQDLVTRAYAMEKLLDLPIWRFLSEKGIDIARMIYDDHQRFCGVHVTRQITGKEAAQYLNECCGLRE